jgi:Fe-S cluster biosynthesis and repair protein YggX
LSRTVHCVILKREAEGLDFAPWAGDLGQRIFEQVSKEAWQQWLAHQTMLINEKHLRLVDPEHKAYLAAQMEAFFFGEGADQPDGWMAPNAD